MEMTLWIVAVAVALGLVQLAAGIILGRCWQAGRSARATAQEARRLERLAQGLFGLSGSLSADVGQHQARIREANRDLESLPSAAASELGGVVLKTVARIIHVNEQLQTRLSDAEEKLKQQARQIQSHMTAAMTDPLTGLPNRRAFDADLLRRQGLWNRGQQACGLLVVDADYFKAINDRFGHPLGDRALRLVAEVVQRTVGEWGVAARIGGEEFAAVVDCRHPQDTQRLAEQIRTTVATTSFSTEHPELRLTVSVGAAMAAPDEDGVSLLKRADQAMYASKRAGRNCTHFHDGRACRRVTPIDTPGAEGPPPEPSEMESLCGDLRIRLAELASTPQEPPETERTEKLQMNTDDPR